MRLRIKNFELSASFSIIALVSISVISGYFQNYALCFVAVILHELGHLLLMLCFGIRVKGLEIKAFNIRIIEARRYYTNLFADLLITLAGPAANFFLFLLFGSSRFGLVNLFLAGFNLLPALSLDGGQALYLILSNLLPQEKALMTVDVITIITAVPLFFIGIIILLASRYNFSLLFISLYLVLSVFFKKDKTEEI